MLSLDELPSAENVPQWSSKQTLDPFATDTSRSGLPIIVGGLKSSWTWKNVSVGSHRCTLAVNSTIVLPTERFGQNPALAVCRNLPSGKFGEILDIEVNGNVAGNEIQAVKRKAVRFRARDPFLTNSVLEVPVEKVYGSSITWMGDIDSDGMAQEFAIGAAGADTGRGRVLFAWISSDGSIRKSVDFGSGSNGMLLQEKASFGASICTSRLFGGYVVFVGAVGDDSGSGAVYSLSLDGFGKVISWTRLARGESGIPSDAWPANAAIGRSLATFGDISDDGGNWLVVGRGGLGTTSLVFVKISNHLKAAAVRVFDGLTSSFGAAIAPFPFVDDGSAGADFLVSAPQDNWGTIFLINVSPQWSLSSSELVLPGSFNTTGFGSSLAAVGDLDGDLVADIVVGATGEAQFTGAVFLVLLNEGFESKEVVRLDLASHVATNSFLGFSLCISDFTGIGRLDSIFVSAMKNNDNTTNYSGSKLLLVKLSDLAPQPVGEELTMTYFPSAVVSPASTQLPIQALSQTPALSFVLRSRWKNFGEVVEGPVSMLVGNGSCESVELTTDVAVSKQNQHYVAVTCRGLPWELEAEKRAFVQLLFQVSGNSFVVEMHGRSPLVASPYDDIVASTQDRYRPPGAQSSFSHGGNCFLGDVNGDGKFNEVLVGEPEASSGRGAAWVLWLSSDGSVKDNGNVEISDGVGGLPIGSLASAARFGSSCASLGQQLANDKARISVFVGAPGDNKVWLLWLDDDGIVAALTSVSHERATGFGSTLLLVSSHEVFIGSVDDDIVFRLLLDDEALTSQTISNSSLEIVISGADVGTSSFVLGSNLALWWFELERARVDSDFFKVARADTIFATGMPSDSSIALWQEEFSTQSRPNLTLLTPSSSCFNGISDIDGSAFGASISSLGDIDSDGIGEVAVGMPDYRDGVGALMILWVEKYRIQRVRILASGTGGMGSRESAAGGFGMSLLLIGNIKEDGWSTTVLVGDSGGYLSAIQFADLAVAPMNSTISLGMLSSSIANKSEFPVPLPMFPILHASGSFGSMLPISLIMPASSTPQNLVLFFGEQDTRTCERLEWLSSWPQNSPYHQNPRRIGFLCITPPSLPEGSSYLRVSLFSPVSELPVASSFVSVTTSESLYSGISPFGSAWRVRDSGNPLLGIGDSMKEFGSVVVSAGDVHVDGNPMELLAGSPADGAVVLLSLSNNSVVSSAKLIQPKERTDMFGIAVTPLFDIDGDGFMREIVVGAGQNCVLGNKQSFVECMEREGTNSKLFYVQFSNHSSDVIRIEQFSSIVQLRRLGSSITILDDGTDGTPRLIVGTPSRMGGFVQVLWLAGTNITRSVTLGDGQGGIPKGGLTGEFNFGQVLSVIEPFVVVVGGNSGNLFDNLLSLHLFRLFPLSATVAQHSHLATVSPNVEFFFLQPNASFAFVEGIHLDGEGNDINVVVGVATKDKNSLLSLSITKNPGGDSWKYASAGKIDRIVPLLPPEGVPLANSLAWLGDLSRTGSSSFVAFGDMLFNLSSSNVTGTVHIAPVKTSSAPAISKIKYMSFGSTHTSFPPSGLDATATLVRSDSSTRSWETSDSILLSLALSDEIQKLLPFQNVSVSIGGAPCINSTLISDWPVQAAKHEMGILCRGVLATRSINESWQKWLRGSSVRFTTFDGVVIDIEGSKTDEPLAFFDVSNAITSKRISGSSPSTLSARFMERTPRISWNVENVFVHSRFQPKLVSKFSQDGSAISVTLKQEWFKDVFEVSMIESKGVIACGSRDTLSISGFGSDTGVFHIGELVTVPPVVSEVKIAPGTGVPNVTQELLHPNGGSEVIIIGTGWGNVDILAASKRNHSCVLAWRSRGLAFPRSGDDARYIPADEVSVWAYINGRPCDMVFWVNSSALRCVAPFGFGRNVHVAVAVGGDIGGFESNVSYARWDPVEFLSQSGTQLPIEGGALVSIGAPAITRYVLDGEESGLRFEGIVLVGPWLFNSSAWTTILQPTSVQNTTNIIPVIAGLVSPPGVGDGHAISFCMSDFPWSSSVAARSLLPFVKRVVTREKTCSREGGAEQGKWVSPVLVSLSPSVDLAPLGGTRVLAQLTDLGTPALLQESGGELQVSVNNIAGSNIVWWIEEGMSFVRFTAPPAEVTTARVVVTIAGRTSNSLTVSYAQTYVISLNPQEVIPGYNLFYSFFIAAVGLSSGEKVNFVTIGDVRCTDPVRSSATVLLCENMEAPPIWRSSMVQIVMEDGNRSTELQRWLRPLPPPSLRAVSSALGFFPTQGGTNVTIFGEGLGVTPTDLVAAYWGNDVDGWIMDTSIELLTSEDATIDLPPGVGAEQCIKVETRGALQSNAVCFSYEPPRITSISPRVFFVGQAEVNIEICAENIGADVAKLKMVAGGLECDDLQWSNVSCLQCMHLPWNIARDPYDGWIDGRVQLLAGGQVDDGSFSQIGSLDFVPPPTIASVKPDTAGPGDSLRVAVSGLDVGLVVMKDIRIGVSDDDSFASCLNVVWIQEGELIGCDIPESHPVWQLQSESSAVIPQMYVQVSTHTGLYSQLTSRASFLPKDIAHRPPPGTATVAGVKAWRPLGQPQGLIIRWRFPGPAAEDSLLSSGRVNDVLPRIITHFDVQVSRDAAFDDLGETRTFPLARSETRTKSAFPSASALNSTESWEWHEYSAIIDAAPRVHARVRGRNSDGTTTWIQTAGNGATENCLQDFYLANPDGSKPFCTPCPEEAVCGGLLENNVTARAGYWRVEWEKTVFAPCPRPESCIGWDKPLQSKAIPFSEIDGISSQIYYNHSSLPETLREQWQLADALIEFESKAIPGLSLLPQKIEGCKKWTRGVLCQSCSAGAFPAVGGVCTECGEPGWIAARLIMLGTAMGAFLALILWRAWKNRGQSSSREVMIAKVLFSHFQAVAILASIDLRWPSAVRLFFDIVDAIASATTSGLALECLMGQSSENPFARVGVIYSAPLWLFVFAALFWMAHGVSVAYFSRRREKSRPRHSVRVRNAAELVRMNVLLHTTEPAVDRGGSTDIGDERSMGPRLATHLPSPRQQTHIQYISFQVSSLMRSCCQECSKVCNRHYAWETFQNQWIQASLVILFLVHTPISKAALRIMTCVPVGPVGGVVGDDDVQLRLAMDLSYACYGSTLGKMIAMGLPMVLFFSFGLPCAAWYFLHRIGASRRGNDDRIRTWLGFLFLGYKKEFFMWESIILLRKVLLAMVTVLLGPYGGGVQALSALLLVLGALVLHSRSHPYESKGMNRLEMLALVVAAITLVGGCYVVFDNRNPQSTGEVALMASISIIGSNTLLFIAAIAQLNQVVRQRCRRVESAACQWIACLHPKKSNVSEFLSMSPRVIGSPDGLGDSRRSSSPTVTEKTVPGAGAGVGEELEREQSFHGEAHIGKGSIARKVPTPEETSSKPLFDWRHVGRRLSSLWTQENPIHDATRGAHLSGPRIIVERDRTSGEQKPTAKHMEVGVTNPLHSKK